mgnify:FL=1
MQDLNSSRFLADRVISGSGLCFRLDDQSGSLCNGHPGPSCNDAGGIDTWQAEVSTQPTRFGCGATVLNDPLGICVTNGSGFVPVQPYNFNVGTGDLDTGAGTARYDFLFVVSPPSITLANMQDTSTSSPSLPYQPYRFKSNGDCNSRDPDNAAPGDCLQVNAINNYGLKLHDVGSNGDPPASDPKRPGVFPVCVLQPNP